MNRHQALLVAALREAGAPVDTIVPASVTVEWADRDTVRVAWAQTACGLPNGTIHYGRGGSVTIPASALDGSAT
jgi:hypothetical protein